MAVKRSTRRLAILLLVGACARAAAAPALDPTRFEADIRAFEAADRASPPHLGGVVFIGSSSIKNWTDVALRRTPERVLGDYRAFVARLRSSWPAARLVYVSIKPSPARRIYIDRMRETNQRIRAEIARDSLQVYVDVFTAMLDATGQPRSELFLADSLHMTRAGYLLWRGLLAPVVR